jgi:hypothetical protein
MIGVTPMTESSEKSGKTFFCQYCQAGWEKKIQLAAHERQCAVNPKNFKEPEIEDNTPDINTILEEAGVSPEVIKLSMDESLEEMIKAKYTEIQQLGDAMKVKKAAEDEQKRKHSKTLLERGYQREPEVFGNYKKVIIINAEYIAPAVDREERAGWEIKGDLSLPAPNGAIYLTFKKK